MNKTRTFHRLRLAALLVLAGLPILCQVGQYLDPDCGFIEVARQVHFAMKL